MEVDELGKKRRAAQPFGRLTVQVVAGRAIEPAIPAGWIFHGSSNPYVILTFQGQQLSSSVCYGSTEPTWNREQCRFDVHLPRWIFNAQPDIEPDAVTLIATVAHRDDSPQPDDAKKKPPPGPPTKPSAAARAGAAAGVCEGDIVLGVAEIHLLDLLAGRVSHIDDWFALGSGGASEGGDAPRARARDVGGCVRMTVGFDILEPPPPRGTKVRLSGLARKRDYWPLPLSTTYEVEDAHGDALLIAYESPEGWRCTSRPCAIGSG